MGALCGAPEKPKKEQVREQRVKGFKKFDRRCYLDIDLENVKWNLHNLSKQAEEIMPVLSHDAFGHGAVQVAQLACSLDVRAFCVSSIKEALELRESKISPDMARILVMGEPLQSSLPVYSAFGLGIVVTCKRTADNLIEWGRMYEGRKKLHAYVLVDTGNTGLGIPARDVVKCVAALKARGEGVVRFCGLVVRTTDDRIPEPNQDGHRGDNTFTLNMFESVVNQLKERDIRLPSIIFENNQPLLFEWDQMARNIGAYLKDTKVYARCSVETFGYQTHQDAETPLRMCLTLKGQIRDIRKVWRGEWCGLGDGWQAPIDSYVATVSCGFADGYPPLRNGQSKQVHVRVNGESYSVIGDICSDHFLIHLGSANVDPNVQVGDYATLFGPQTQDPENLEFAQLAEIAGMHQTQMLCHMASRLEKQWKSTSLTRRNTLTKLNKKKDK